MGDYTKEDVEKADSTELALDRTEWAEDRTILANERTFAGWMRTGMAALGMALGLKAVFGDFEPTWLAKAASSIFVVIAILIFYAAARNSAKAQARIDSHITQPQSVTRFKLLASLLALGAVSTGLILWFL
jgi:putative membrane protein